MRNANRTNARSAALSAAVANTDGWWGMVKARHVEAEIDAALVQAAAAMDAAWAAGGLTPNRIDAAIGEHRRRHPYGRED